MKDFLTTPSRYLPVFLAMLVGGFITGAALFAILLTSPAWLPRQTNHTAPIDADRSRPPAQGSPKLPEKPDRSVNAVCPLCGHKFHINWHDGIAHWTTEVRCPDCRANMAEIQYGYLEDEESKKRRIKDEKNAEKQWEQVREMAEKERQRIINEQHKKRDQLKQEDIP